MPEVASHPGRLAFAVSFLVALALHATVLVYTRPGRDDARSERLVLLVSMAEVVPEQAAPHQAEPKRAARLQQPLPLAAPQEWQVPLERRAANAELARKAPRREPETPAVVEAHRAPEAASERLATRRRADLVRGRYEQLLAAWLDRHKYYPRRARQLGMEGSAVVRIRIDRAGHVRSHAIERRLAYDVLNRAVEGMIEEADPFPPMPHEYSGDVFEFRVPIDFRLTAR